MNQKENFTKPIVSTNPRYMTLNLKITDFTKKKPVLKSFSNINSA